MTPATATTPETQPATADSESAEPPQSLISQAGGMRKEWADKEANDRRDSHAQVVALYIVLLSRNDNPREGDVRELAQTMIDLEIDEERVARDIKIVERARMFERRHDDKEAAHAKYIAAMDEYRALEKRHKEKEQAAYRKKLNAKQYIGECTEANGDLIHMRRQRPLLFTEGHNLRVRLLDALTVE